jgi:hypothetical protein
MAPAWLQRQRRHRRIVIDPQTRGSGKSIDQIVRFRREPASRAHQHQNAVRANTIGAAGDARQIVDDAHAEGFASVLDLIARLLEQRLAMIFVDRLDRFRRETNADAGRACGIAGAP